MTEVPTHRRLASHRSPARQGWRMRFVRLFFSAWMLASLAGIEPRDTAAQTSPDLPSLPSSPGAETQPVGPAVPPDTAANPPLSVAAPPSPAVGAPTPILLPESTPRPIPPPLPVADQAGGGLSPTAAGTTLTNGAPGTTPATDLSGGATTTNNIGAVRRFGYAFRLSTGVTYDSNVFLAGDNVGVRTANGANVGNTNGNTNRFNGQSRSDVYYILSPSVSLGLGDFLGRATNFVELDYTLQALLYTRNTGNDTVQHFINFQGGYHFAEVTLTLTQGVQILNSTDIGANGSSGLLSGYNASTGTGQQPASSVNLDASQRTGLNIYTTHLNANYSISDKTSVDLDGNLSINDYEALISSTVTTGDVFFNYSVTGKTTLGLGGTFGYTVQSNPPNVSNRQNPVPDQYDEQLNLRLNYVLSDKLAASGSVGLEFREIVGYSNVDVNPVFNLGISYAPFESTSVALGASRRVETSAAVTGQNFDATGFTITFNQRFFQKVYTHLSVGYTHSSYTNVGTVRGSDRTDDYYFIQPSIDYQIRDNLSAGIYYIHRQSNSTLSGNSFNDDQIGARASINF